MLRMENNSLPLTCLEVPQTEHYLFTCTRIFNQDYWTNWKVNHANTCRITYKTVNLWPPKKLCHVRGQTEIARACGCRDRSRLPFNLSIWASRPRNLSRRLLFSRTNFSSSCCASVLKSLATRTVISRSDWNWSHSVHCNTISQYSTITVMYSCAVLHNN